MATPGIKLRDTYIVVDEAASPTHAVVYDKTTGYVHAIVDLATAGAWTNSATWATDGYLTFDTLGKLVSSFTDEEGVLDVANVGVFHATAPTKDSNDWEAFGVLEVDDTTTPTDTQERTDGNKDPDYEYGG